MESCEEDSLGLIAYGYNMIEKIDTESPVNY